MHPHLAHRLNDLRLRDVHAAAARDRLVARAIPSRPAARTALARSLSAALAAVALVLGAR